MGLESDHIEVYREHDLSHGCRKTFETMIRRSIDKELRKAMRADCRSAHRQRARKQQKK